MKRVILFAHTTMTLFTCVYYSSKLKSHDKRIKTVLIWTNSTSYNISIRAFSSFFDETYTVSGGIGDGKRFSLDHYMKYLECRSYLRKSDIGRMLAEHYEREILMTGSDYNNIMKSIIDIFSRKRNRHRVILFEEGLALYDAKRTTVKDVISYFSGKKKDELAVIGQSAKLNVIFAQHPEELPSWKKRDRIVIQQSDVFSDASLMKEMLSKETCLAKMQNRLLGKKVLLYLGQPIRVFDNDFRLTDERAFIEQIVNIMPEDYVILIKGHPREPFSKYQYFESNPRCVLFDKRISWYPMEFLLPLFDVKYVMAFASSAAINIAERVEGCRAVYTYKCMKVDIPQAWRTMLERTDNKVVVPDTVEKIQIILQADTFVDNDDGLPKRNDKDLKYLFNYLA